MKSIKNIAPSILSANFLDLDNDLKEIEKLGMDRVHFDVMDGHFVNEITFGEQILKKILSKYEDVFDIDVHLMVSNPFDKLIDFANVDGIDKVSIHFEVINAKKYDQSLLKIFNNPFIDRRVKYDGFMFEYNKRILKAIRDEYPDLLIGLAINPCTDIKEVEKYIPLFDYFLIMSVVPGKGGQSFIEGSEKKIKFLDNYRKKNELDYFIEVDGGINNITGKLCLENGADVLVCGSYYFKAENKIDAINKILR